MPTITVTELMLNFRDACRALIPSLDRACVPWTDNEQYDGWDRIAESLFVGLVAEPCIYQSNAAGFQNIEITRYGFIESKKGQNAFLGFAEDDARFIQLVSPQQPFSHFIRLRNGRKELVLVDQAQFNFVVVDDIGERHRLSSIDLSL